MDNNLVNRLALISGAYKDHMLDLSTGKLFTKNYMRVYSAIINNIYSHWYQLNLQRFVLPIDCQKEDPYSWLREERLVAKGTADSYYTIQFMDQSDGTLSILSINNDSMVPSKLYFNLAPMSVEYVIQRYDFKEGNLLFPLRYGIVETRVGTNNIEELLREGVAYTKDRASNG